MLLFYCVIIVLFYCFILYFIHTYIYIYIHICKWLARSSTHFYNTIEDAMRRRHRRRPRIWIRRIVIRFASCWGWKGLCVSVLGSKTSIYFSRIRKHFVFFEYFVKTNCSFEYRIRIRCIRRRLSLRITIGASCTFFLFHGKTLVETPCPQMLDQEAWQ